MLFMTACTVTNGFDYPKNVPTPVYGYQLEGIFCTTTNIVMQVIQDNESSSGTKATFNLIINDIQHTGILLFSGNRIYVYDGNQTLKNVLIIIDRNILFDMNSVVYRKCVDHSTP